MICFAVHTLDTATSHEPTARRQCSRCAFLVLGDLSGEAARERPALGSRPTHAVDLDTVASVMRRLAPRLRLAQGDVQFNEIEDFHSDRLVGRVEVFRALREKRAHPPADGSDFARLLGEAAESVAPPSAAPLRRLDALIREMIAPHIVKDTSAHDKMYIDAVDAAIALEMRAILHAPALQRLEAAWRGVHWLISSLELNETLELHVFDVTREEILADVAAANGKITSTGLYQALVDRWRNVPGAQGWTAFVTLVEFDQSDTDVGLLAALGLMAAQAGAPILGGAASMLSDDGVPADEAGWNALRRSEVAPWIGLGAPGC